MPGETRLTLTVPAEAASLDRLHAAVAELWTEEPGVGSADRLAFETALAEVAGNVVQHATAGLGLDLTVDLAVHPDRLEARLSDRGRAASVRLDDVVLPDELAESGRGLALAVAAVDQVDYRHEDGVNHWLLVRRRHR
ncbi:ATP-binding protein [Geodermatophilus sp. SYSU D00815]